MRFSPPLRMSIIRRGEKERRLGAFVGQHLAAAAASAPEPGHEIRLIARSAESPVFKVIAASAAEIAAAGHSLRVILAQPDRDALARWMLCDAGAVECEVRWARDPRLIEVHEQLVLGPRTCWTGDSMRRDPAKCDALETFIDDCAETAGTATASFERLWTASEPLPWSPPVVRDASRPAAPERRV
jgi:hypothetical protein